MVIYMDQHFLQILKSTALAEALEIELVSISCELVAANHYDSNWRELIKKVRRVFKKILG